MTGPPSTALALLRQAVGALTRLRVPAATIKAHLPAAPQDEPLALASWLPVLVRAPPPLPPARALAPAQRAPLRLSPHVLQAAPWGGGRARCATPHVACTPAAADLSPLAPPPSRWTATPPLPRSSTNPPAGTSARWNSGSFRGTRTCCWCAVLRRSD